MRVRIEPWAESDFDLLRRANAPEMTEHIGGPETEEQLVRRHKRYVDIAGTGTGRMFSVLLHPELEAVGTLGYWERVWRDEVVYEAGWSVFPRFQGRGIAERLPWRPRPGQRRNTSTGICMHPRPSTIPRRTRSAGRPASPSSLSATSNSRQVTSSAPTTGVSTSPPCRDSVTP